MLEITLPLKTISEANSRDHWRRKAQRAKVQRNIASVVTQSEMIGFSEKDLTRPIIIKFVRYGKRPLDCDNLAGSFKAIRDGVCDALGIDDGAECLRFFYAQDKGEYSVKVFVC